MNNSNSIARSGTTYRVFKHLVNDFVSEKDREQLHIIWEGQDRSELSKHYPPSSIFGADSLGYHQIEDGYISWWYHFEVLTSDGIWEECKDPRVKGLETQEFRDREDEIEIENRKYFPGDYLIEDDYEPEYPDSYSDDD